ncbi:MAG: exonuclease domain-containing protein [Bacteroidetes bacterium]|nr:exonuclease domain-containing protein [Bacteroidota bacterium]
MYAIIDVEASGGNPLKDRVIEVAIFIHNGKRVTEQFCTLVNPGVYISPFISSLTRITNEMVADAPTFAEIADKIIEITDGKVFVAHNVRFDYSCITNEFKRMGSKYIRKQLCTVKLSRSLLPGLPSYSLGKLCQSLGIPIEHRHRAFGDAAATAQLFDLMLKREKDKIMEEVLKETINNNLIPPNVKQKEVDELPEESGIYYFKDEKGKILYIGKSTNIRKRVLSHFSEDIHSEKHIYLKQKMHSVDYELTGNELLALVVESQEIKRWMPEFNHAQKRRLYRYGIYKEYDKEGFLNLRMRMLKLDEEPLIYITHRRRGEETLRHFAERNNLCFAHCNVDLNGSSKGCMNYLNGRCSGACVGKETANDYNIKVEKSLETIQFNHPNFFIVSEGRRPQEKSVISIENGKYKGFGFFEDESSEITDLQMLKEFISPYPSHPDIHKIIRGFLRKKTKGTVVIEY